MVNARRMELALMRGLGVPRGKVFWTFFLEQALLCLLGSICFLGVCALSDSRRGLALGSGLCVVCILLQMLAQSGDKWEWLRYLTPLTAFDSTALAAGGGSLWPALGLAGGAACLYATGIFVFTRRDLCL